MILTVGRKEHEEKTTSENSPNMKKKERRMVEKSDK